MKKIVKGFGFGLLCCLVVFLYRHIKEKYKATIEQITKDRDKLSKLFIFSNKWMQAKITGSDVKKYLEKNNYINIAIYGMAYMGQTLVEDLEESSISVKYGIDRDAEIYWADFPIITPKEISDYDFSQVDAVIVTAITFFEEIKSLLSKELECPVISLEDMI